jgi:hypothetical protein
MITHVVEAIGSTRVFEGDALGEIEDVLGEIGGTLTESEEMHSGKGREMHPGISKEIHPERSKVSAEG